ncbi:MAG: carbohydrate ABC transporter permease [Vicinamibacterales bacterium]
MSTATARQRDRRDGWLLVAPALAVIVAVALVPIVATAWTALHGHDLRLPWLGRPFVGAGNFVEAAGDPRARAAVLHTVVFALVSVPIELAVGLVLALVMHRATRGRGLLRVTALLPWAIPTVVAALVWRFMFDAQTGLSGAFAAAGAEPYDWFASPLSAWVPIVGADVWKTSPFVAMLLLAGLQTIDPAVDDAARIDGAGAVRHFWSITLPLLGPSVVVAAAFRMLDALRLFDLAYVVTGGGPGTATEPLSLYAFVVLTDRLRFGYGSALSLATFLIAFACALLWVRALGRVVEDAHA